MRRGAEALGIVVEREMGRGPARILRRAGMKIVGAVAELPQHRARDDDAAGERNQPGVTQHVRFQCGEVVERERAMKRQLWIMLPQQGGQRPALLSIACKQNDGFQHRVTGS